MFDIKDDEIEIATFNTGLALADTLFTDGEKKDSYYLYPLLSELLEKFDGKIKEPGFYAIRTQIVKIK